MYMHVSAPARKDKDICTERCTCVPAASSVTLACHHLIRQQTPVPAHSVQWSQAASALVQCKLQALFLLLQWEILLGYRCACWYTGWHYRHEQIALCVSACNTCCCTVTKHSYKLLLVFLLMYSWFASDEWSCIYADSDAIKTAG